MDPAARAVEDHEDEVLAVEGRERGSRGEVRDHIPGSLGVEAQEFVGGVGRLPGIPRLVELFARSRATRGWRMDAASPELGDLGAGRTRHAHGRGPGT